MTAWTVTVDNITDGLVTVMNLTAERKCGRQESLIAYQFPAGWRMSATNVPVTVRNEALRLVKEVWP